MTEKTPRTDHGFTDTPAVEGKQVDKSLVGAPPKDGKVPDAPAKKG